VDSGVGNNIQNIIEHQEIIQEEVNHVLDFFVGHIPDIIAFGVNIVLAILLFIVGRLVVKCLCKIIRKHLERSNVDAGVSQFINSFARVALYVLLVFLIAQVVGVASSSAAALLASIGVAIGLAMQGSLANMVGGVLILLLKPFVVGDYIIAHNGNNEGMVKEISMFYTKLHSIDNKVVIIPNGMLSNSSITNVAERPRRQLDLRVTISYKEDIDKVKKILGQILEETPEVIEEEEINIFVDELGRYGVEIGVRGWVKTSEFITTRCKVLEQIKIIFEKEKIEIPTQQL
jgi:small conductance mechanosensitive channel